MTRTLWTQFLTSDPTVLRSGKGWRATGSEKSQQSQLIDFWPPYFEVLQSFISGDPPRTRGNQGIPAMAPQNCTSRACQDYPYTQVEA